jgi:hypothetical protein
LALIRESTDGVRPLGKGINLNLIRLVRPTAAKLTRQLQNRGRQQWNALCYTGKIYEITRVNRQFHMKRRVLVQVAGVAD